MIKRFRYIVALFVVIPFISMADEGMWIPSNIPDSIFRQMQLSGFELSKKDIYNPDSTSLIDAVPMFGKGCSSGVISADGLIITNFHCARYYIQSHSSLANNLLDKGFTATKRSEELPNANLTVEFTRKIIDVTQAVLAGTTENTELKIRDSITGKNIAKIEKRYSDSLHLIAKIEPIFFGNNYLLYLRQEYKDIRLVYSPPEPIADYGGDKDNWMWPRHSADFAIFRIYSDSLNAPKEISKDNIPYKPKKYLSISTKGKKENDFTMVLGYPGSTEEYLPKIALEAFRDSLLPIKIFARKKRLDIMKLYMDSSRYTHLNYTTKYKMTSNDYLKWLCDEKQLTNSNKSVISKNLFFIDSTLEPQLNKAYSNLSTSQKMMSFYYEGLMSMDIIRFAFKLKTLLNKSKNHTIETIIPLVRNFYKTYTPEIDRDFYLHLLNDINSIPQRKNILDIIIEAKTQTTKSQYEKVAMNLYKSSLLLDSIKLFKLIKKYPTNWVNILEHDHIYTLSDRVFRSYILADKEVLKQTEIIDSLQRINIRKLLSQKKILYSDANATIRFSYGIIKSYESTDAIIYDYKTTMAGIKEKAETENADYMVDKELFSAIKPSVSTCVISTCHTTGGNSGSPMINGNGQFIGLNFDRNIEGTINDYIYRGQIARNIWVDSEYILQLLKNYSKATYVLQSLEIVQ